MSSNINKDTGVGVLNCQEIERLISGEVITAAEPIADGQIQPASLDLRLGTKAYRILSSFLPENHGVEERLRMKDLHGSDIIMYELDIPADGAILEKNNVYLIPLMEALNLPEDLRARANPKSTTGRLDIFTRVITDRSHLFDNIASGYKGGLYLEVMPRSFPIKIKAGQRLVQLRLTRGSSDYTVPDDQLMELHAGQGVLFNEDGSIVSASDIRINKGVFMSVDLSGDNPAGVVAYKSRKNSHYVDMSLVNHYNIEEFWEPIHKNTIKDTLILEPEEFYILASKERISIPEMFAAEMVPYEAGSGELRTHYAGFFDPGFGYGRAGELKGTKAVLEVRAHDVPFMITDGQKICKLNFEKMAAAPSMLYGADIGSSYQGQGIKLSKHFKDG